MSAHARALAGAAAVLLAPTPAKAADTELRLQDRVPLAFLLVSPSGASAQVRSSEVIDIVSELFETHTDFSVRLVDPESVTDCAGRLPCLVQAVRTDYVRDRLTGPDGVQPFSVHVRQLEAQGLVVPEFLFVLSSVAFGGRDRLISQWVDTDEALAIAHEADRSAPDWERDVEARVRAYAVPIELPSRSVRSGEEARRFLGALITEHLRPELERSGHWEPYADLTLAPVPSGATVRVDGRTVGITSEGSVAIRGLRPGSHTIELERTGYTPWSEAIRVERGAALELSPELRRPSRTHPGRQVIFWSGLGVGVAGLAIGAFALAHQPSDSVTYCPSPCGDRFTTLGEDPSPPTGFRSRADGGVLAAPLGYSLALTGAGWSLGSAFLGADEDFPWWGVIGGLVLGGTAYGLSVALDPGPP